MKKKSIALLMAAVMLFGVAVGGTLAWLKDTTNTVENTFVVGQIDIELDEKDVDNSTPDKERDISNQYDIVPGSTYEKDPTVVVKAKSEKCYLFVKFEEVGNPSTYYTYESLLNTTNGWTEIDTGVWYKIVESQTTDQSFYLLGGNKDYANGYITVKDTVTQENMAAAGEASLKWTAYAVQFENRTPEQAWDLAKTTS